MAFSCKYFNRHTHQKCNGNNTAENEEHVKPTALIGNVTQGKGAQGTTKVTRALTDTRHTSRVETVAVEQRNMTGGNIGNSCAT